MKHQETMNHLHDTVIERRPGMAAPYALHLISHTHWDREWHLSFQQFRMRLVRLVDELLDILERDADYHYFMLDGQTIILEDYLEIRPENAGRLRKLIGEGRLLIGPWYVLPDEFLVSGESILRNLLYGGKTAAALGPVMPVGYLPDQFGHISQMPQILKGFGLENAVIWRGVGEADGRELESEFLWEAPDGSQVLALRLPAERSMSDETAAQASDEIPPNDGYSNAASLPVDPEAATRRIECLAKKLGAFARTPHLLLMNGVDHIRPQRELPEIIRGVNARLTCGKIEHSTLPRIFEAIRAEHPQLRAIGGEFRRRRLGDVLFGTLSARTYLKQANHEAQSELERWAEPFSTFAWLLGGDDPRPYLDLAWKLLLKNHPHDSICGCSIDAVHEEMLTRYASCRQITGELLTQALHRIAAKIDRTFLGEGERALALFNPSIHPRSDLVEATIYFPESAKVAGFTLHDLTGEKIPFTVLREERNVFELNPNQYLAIDRIDRFEISFSVGRIPALGYRCYIARPAPGGGGPPSDDGKAEPSDHAGLLENERLKVEMRVDGSFDLLDKKTGHTCRGCNLLEDGGDMGDLYNYSPPAQDERVFGLAHGRISRAGPHSARVEGELRLPRAAGPDRRRRSVERVTCPASVTVTLRELRVEVRLEMGNHAKDHRLRALFPTGLKAKHSHAAGQFDVIARPIGVEEEGLWFEDPLPTYPQENFVDISDGRLGMAFFSRGLVEYEAVPRAGGVTLALTLMRCVEAVTRGDLTTTKRRQAASVWHPTPGGQCLGERVFEYAVYPHFGGWEEAKVFDASEQYRLPCRSISLERKEGGALKPESGFLEVEPDFLELSAVKVSEDGEGLAVRLFNPTGQEGEGKLKLLGKTTAVERVGLGEHEIENLAISPEGTLSFRYGKKEIVTLRIKR